MTLLPAAACSGGGTTPGATAASESSSPTASATPAARPTPTSTYKPADASGRAQNVPVPVLPEAAKAETKEGLEAFARYWYSLLNYAYETGDLSLIKAVSGPTCALCGKVFPGIEKWNAEGRWIVGAKITVHAVQSTFVRTDAGDFQVAIQSQQVAGSLRNPDGTEGQAVTESGMLGDILVAKHQNGSWAVKNVDRLGS
ncbi:MAG: DUF6318 family protein [Arthrobacter sp.]